MAYVNNLKECIVQKKTSGDTNNTEEGNDNKNYDIKLKRSELKDLIFALNIVITDIKNNQNKVYIISEIENIISKLNKADVPPNIELNRIPTFSTVDLKENNTTVDDNYYPYMPCLSGSLIDNKTYVSRVEPVPNSNLNMEKYEGQMINGKKEGKGIYIYRNGCKYEGYFQNDKKEGIGIFYYSNGDRYKGYFHEGFYHGNGVFYFNNGDRYEGQFVQNKYSGKGKYFYHNGDRFEGQWLNDKKNGQGAYIYLNGDRILGHYYEGKPVGTHIKYFRDGKVSQIIYSKA